MRLNRCKLISQLGKQLSATEFYSTEDICMLQNRKLTLLLKSAYENTVYYRDIFDMLALKPTDIVTIDDLKKIPILDKETLRSRHDDLINAKIKCTHHRTTTGSTGVPLDVVYSEDNKLMEMALMRRFERNIGVNGLKEINLWGRPQGDLRSMLIRKIKSYIYNIRYENVYDYTRKDFLELLCKLQYMPHIYLRGFANGVYMLALAAQSKNIKLDISAISVTAEKLYSYQRALINRYLGTNLYDQYGCGEINSIAFECDKHNGLHHAFEHSIIELENEVCDEYGNRTGELIITNLDNLAMPLIRYKNGDIVTISANECKCGRKGILLKTIEGRLYDFITGPNGRSIHSAFLDHILVESNILYKNGVKEIRIVQTAINEICIQYVCDKVINENDFAFFVKAVSDKLGDISFGFQRVDSIKNMKSGKRKFVVPLCDYEKDKTIL